MSRSMIDENEATALIARLIAFKSDAVGVADKLLEAFHGGLPVSKLEPLLRNQDRSIAIPAGWILSELGRKGAPLLQISRELLSHGEPEIRIDAITNILANSRPGDAIAAHTIVSRYESEIPEVKEAILNYMARVPVELLRAAAGHASETERSVHVSGVALHASTISVEIVSSSLRSASALARAYAISACRRLDLIVNEGYKLAVKSSDPIVSAQAERWLLYLEKGDRD